MDPANVIGIVSGVLTFTSDAEKILKLSWNIYHSTDGSSEETKMRLQLAESMDIMISRIIRPNQPTVAEEDKPLFALAQGCDKLANDFKKELQDLGPKKRRSLAHSGIAALKTLRLDPKLKDLEKKLEHCRNQLHFHIAVLSRENLKAILIVSKNDTTKISQLQRSVTQLGQTIREIATNKVGNTSEETLNQLKGLLDLGQETLNHFTQDRILRGIKAGFDDMSYRYQSIDTPFNDTLEWVWALDDQSVEAKKFTQWLSSGDGIFHICGKLGAGKSTLMKNLYKQERTKIELNKWMHAKGGQTLIMANFFFYALGSDPRQKSLMGLYRTLLYQILSGSPSTIQNLLPEHWNKALSQPKIHSAVEILDDDIVQAYRLLSSQKHNSSLNSCFFAFFIDGLDEYEATISFDRREMVEILLKLSSHPSGRFKICVSSRMENPFMDVFSNDKRLYLHDLTKSDMEKYVQGKLQQVGTEAERQQIASSITKKAQGVFLWVVLVVKNMRRQSDNGVKFSRLIGEVELLPTELNGLFQGIIDSLEIADPQLLAHTVSLLHFLGTIPEAKSMHLWLTLGDFYFFEDFAIDNHFAERMELQNPETEKVAESETRAGRRLRGACRGLLEADKTNNIDFIHRSVADFFAQEQISVQMESKSFNNMEALSQLKLASIKHYWWDKGKPSIGQDYEGNSLEDEVLAHHAILAACLIEQRRKQNLDTVPFTFLDCLDSIPQLSVEKMVEYAYRCGKTAFRIVIPQKDYLRDLPYTQYEICHTSRMQHKAMAPDPNPHYLVKYRTEFADEPLDSVISGVTLRNAEEDVDEVTAYSISIISPLFTELCSGRLEYPQWRMVQTRENRPLEQDKLIMLVYCAVALGIGRVIWVPGSFDSTAQNDEAYLDNSQQAGFAFLDYLFAEKIVSPNLLTHLAFGGEFGFIRIAAGIQQLSIWQHVLCWWITVAAASGDFISDHSLVSYDSLIGEAEPFNSHEDQIDVFDIMHILINAGADVHFSFQIEDIGSIPSTLDRGWWWSYALEILLDGKDALTIDVVLNTNSEMSIESYPYRLPNERSWHIWKEKASSAIPKVPLSVRDWIDCSRLPDKDILLKLIDERGDR